MAQNFEGQLCSATVEELAFEDRVGLMVDEEITFRDNKRLKRLLHTAKLQESACIEDSKYLPPVTRLEQGSHRFIGHG